MMDDRELLSWWVLSHRVMRHICRILATEPGTTEPPNKYLIRINYKISEHDIEVDNVYMRCFTEKLFQIFILILYKVSLAPRQVRTEANEANTDRTGGGREGAVLSSARGSLPGTHWENTQRHNHWWSDKHKIKHDFYPVHTTTPASVTPHDTILQIYSWWAEEFMK